MKSIFLAAGLYWILMLSACQTHPKNFVESSEVITHVPTGIAYPKKIKGWESAESLRRENISPEIYAELRYFAQDLDREIRPSVSVFFMKGSSTANIKLIENKEVLGFIRPLQLRSDIDVRLPSKRKIFTISYEHLASLSQEAVGVSVHKEIKLKSTFVQSLKNPRLVFLITTQENRMNDQKMALQMMDDFMPIK